MDHRLEIILAGKDATKHAFQSVQSSIKTVTRNVFSLKTALGGLFGAVLIGRI